MKANRVLVSAYACEPGAGSEAGVGWNIACELARHAEVWVITRSNNRDRIEQALPAEVPGSLHFVYCDLPRWAMFWKRKHRGVQLYYYLWQILAYRTARSLIRRVPFDLIHHVTFVKYWAPSFMPLLPVPFVWGPLGGGDGTPWALWRGLSWRGSLYETFRETARWLGEHDPFVRLAARRSVLALAVTPRTAERLRRLGAPRVEMFPQCGLNDEEIRRLSSFTMPPAEPVRFISVGQLLHLKGFDLGLRAFHRANIAGARYWIVGEGPERARLQDLARALGITRQVRFLGQLSREETLDRIGRCHILLHPSMHDSGGWVCTEAMAAGKPVISLDCGGPALQVTSQTGIKVAPGSTEKTVEALAEAMVKLAVGHDLRGDMSLAARAAVHDACSWRSKASQLMEFYSRLPERAA